VVCPRGTQVGTRYINYPVPGLIGSPEKEHLTFFKLTRQVHGHTVGATSSIGCQSHSRPYPTTFPEAAIGAASRYSLTDRGTLAWWVRKLRGHLWSP
jgi:hypothetical protein